MRPETWGHQSVGLVWVELWFVWCSFGCFLNLELRLLKGFSRHQSPYLELTFLTMTKCLHLNKLVIVENCLSGKLPASIGNFSTSLEIFAAYRCRIQGKTPKEIGKWISLATLSLSDNELTWIFSTSVKGLHCSAIVSTQQQDNRIYCRWNIQFEEHWCINNILKLNASSNMLVGHLPAEIGSLKTMTLIDLLMNNLSGSIPNTIGGL